MFVRTFLSELKRITNAFCDAVLGPVAQKSNWQGEIVEVHGSEPEKLDNYIKEMLTESSGSMALLGATPESVAHYAQPVLLMPAQSAAQMLYAASELIKSQAIDLIVMQDLLLRSDFSSNLGAHLRQLKTQVGNSNVKVVLLNPESSERKMILSELEVVCSRQIAL